MEILNRFATDEECARFGDFLEWLDERGRSEATARSYRSDWQDLTLWARRSGGAPFDAGALTAEVVQAWRDAGSAKGRSPATLTRRQAFARTYAGWLQERGVISADVHDSLRSEVRLVRDRNAPRVLADREVHQLLAHVDARGCPRDQALFYLLIDTGLRVGELVELDVGDVDLVSGGVTVRKPWPRRAAVPMRSIRKLAWSLAERGLVTVTDAGELRLPTAGAWPPTRSRAPEQAPLLPVLRAPSGSPQPFDESGPPGEWPLFVGERGRLTANAVQRIVRKHATFARVDASPQILRHTFARQLWLQRGDLVELANALGLETIESARTYALGEPQREEIEVEEARPRLALA